MSDNETKKPAGGTGAWTEEEKIGLLFSIIEASGVKMDWSSIRLPPGRTVKACSVWLDKQRAARRKLRAEAGDDGEVVKTVKTPAKSRKRVAKDVPEGEGERNEEATPKAKKPKTPRKKKEAAVKVQVGADAEENVHEMVKTEIEDEMMN